MPYDPCRSLGYIGISGLFEVWFQVRMSHSWLVKLMSRPTGSQPGMDAAGTWVAVVLDVLVMIPPSTARFFVQPFSKHDKHQTSMIYPVHQPCGQPGYGICHSIRFQRTKPFKVPIDTLHVYTTRNLLLVGGCWGPQGLNPSFSPQGFVSYATLSFQTPAWPSSSNQQVAWGSGRHDELVTYENTCHPHESFHALTLWNGKNCRIEGFKITMDTWSIK